RLCRLDHIEYRPSTGCAHPSSPVAPFDGRSGAGTGTSLAAGNLDHGLAGGAAGCRGDAERGSLGGTYEFHPALQYSLLVRSVDRVADQCHCDFHWAGGGVLRSVHRKNSPAASIYAALAQRYSAGLWLWRTDERRVDHRSAPDLQFAADGDAADGVL